MVISQHDVLLARNECGGAQRRMLETVAILSNSCTAHRLS